MPACRQEKYQNFSDSSMRVSWLQVYDSSVANAFGGAPRDLQRNCLTVYSNNKGFCEVSMNGPNFGAFVKQTLKGLGVALLKVLVWHFLLSFLLVGFKENEVDPSIPFMFPNRKSSSVGKSALNFFCRSSGGGRSNIPAASSEPSFHAWDFLQSLIQCSYGSHWFHA